MNQEIFLCLKKSADDLDDEEDEDEEDEDMMD